MAALKKKSFLFLQGPPGPFFARLGTALRDEGHEVRRINFNGGDRHCWPAEATDFRGAWADWPRFFDVFVRRHGVTDLVLFGDCRPMHRAVHSAASLAGARIHVFEEGYIRPDWMTLELGGVNGHSSLPRDPQWYVEAASRLPPQPTPAPVATGFERRVREAISYYFYATFLGWRYPGYRSHRVHWPPIEGVGWLLRLAMRPLAVRRAEQTLQRLRGARYFVFPLQLDTDSQIRHHSPFATGRAALAHVIESFARAASPDQLLVIKKHPLDSGLIHWRLHVAAACRRYGSEGRVLLVDEADIAPLIAQAQGVVTVNSTTGTLAVACGVPTMVLGDAVYNLEGITQQGLLDDFWNLPVRPDPAVWNAFARVLVDRCLIRGDFASDEGIDMLVKGSIARLCDGAMPSAVSAKAASRLRDLQSA